MAKMTRLEALAKGRASRINKILKNIYEENKYSINSDHYVSYDQWLNAVKGNMKFNPRYKGDTLVKAARKYMHSRAFVSAEDVGIENMKSRLRDIKTGNKIKWGREKRDNATPWWTERKQLEREETLYDQVRSLIGWFNKMNFFWDDRDKTYHFTSSDNLEYAVMVVPPSPFTYELVVVNSERYHQLLRKYEEYEESKGRDWRKSGKHKYR